MRRMPSFPSRDAVPEAQCNSPTFYQNEGTDMQEKAKAKFRDLARPWPDRKSINAFVVKFLSVQSIAIVGVFARTVPLESFRSM